GGSAPAGQSFTVANGGGGTLAWSVSESTAWLSVSPSSGTNAGSVTVSLDPSDLTAGAYSADVTVSAPGAAARTVRVTVTVSAAGSGAPGGGAPGGTPLLGVSTNQMNFAATIDGQSSPQTLSITTGDPTVRWTAAPRDRWIEVSPRSGTGNGTLTVTLDLQGGTPGIFDGSIRITASGVANSPQTVNLRLVVSPAPGNGGPGAPVIDVSPASLRFDVAPFSSVSSPQSFTLRNVGGGTLAWTVDATQTWIQVGQASGSGNNQLVEVRVDPTNLANGSHTGDVRVRAEGASNTQTIRVTMRIGTGSGVLSKANVDVTSPGSEDRVDGYDIVAELRGIETGEKQYDVNGDGKVDSQDVDMILANFGEVQ
ncbi:MAG: BACON domain-containing protein, partial [Gemmatimonadota bacterium]